MLCSFSGSACWGWGAGIKQKVGGGKLGQEVLYDPLENGAVWVLRGEVSHSRWSSGDETGGFVLEQMRVTYRTRVGSPGSFVRMA